MTDGNPTVCTELTPEELSHLSPAEQVSAFRCLQETQRRNYWSWMLTVYLLFPITLWIAFRLQTSETLLDDVGKSSEVRGATLLEAMNQHDTAMIVVSTDNRIVGWNVGARNLLGWAPDEIVGKPLTTLMPSQVQASHLIRFASPAVLFETVISRPIWRIRCDVRTKTGELPAVLDVRALRCPPDDPKKSLYLVVINAEAAIRDVSLPSSMRTPQ